MQSLSNHETKQHGTLEFPAEYYYIDSSYPRYNMSFHWHKEWELIYVIEGTFFIHAGEEQYTAKSGDALLIRDGMLHGGTPTDCVYECFVFDLHGLFRNLDVVKKYLRPLYHHHVLPQIFYSAARDGEIAAAVADLMKAYRKTMNTPAAGTAFEGDASLDEAFHHTKNMLPSAIPGDFHELMTISCLSRLLTLILQKGCYTVNPEDTPSSSHRINQLKTVLEYIENHYASPISLDVMAKEAGMNPKYFCRFFRSITHQTPLDYVNYYRIEQAAQMLLSSDLSVTDIGMECGFNDSSYFVKVFRKYRGVTPNQYRKTNH